MKYNKVGVIVTTMAVLLMTLPSTAVFAEDQKSEDNNNRNRESIESTSSDDDKDKSVQEQDEKRDEDDQRRTTSEDQEDTTSTGKRMSDEHRSNVSNFVKNLLKTADENNGGIGEEVRKIAKEEDESSTTTTDAIKKIEDRSFFKTFLIGTDYKNIGVIRSQIAKTQARIDQLSRLLGQTTTSTISASTTEQLLTLKQTEDKLASFVSEHENKFSLFGWFTRLFSK